MTVMTAYDCLVQKPCEEIRRLLEVWPVCAYCSAGLGADWSGDQQMDQVSKTKGGWTLLKCYLAGTKIDCIKWEVHV